ncbi:Panacea domain-containing protein [Aeromonas veronii]
MAISTIDDVATYLIQQSEIGITHRELQKILYYAQGFYLAKNNEPLFEGEFDAWKFGPVNTSVWSRFKSFGYNPLHVSSEAEPRSLDSEKKAFLSAILGAFLVLGQSKLIDISHTDYTWKGNYIPGINKRIPQEEIKNFFSSFESYKDYLETAKTKLAFSSLISARIEYLSELPSLGEDWISGRAFPPSEEICKVCAKYLCYFEKNLFSRHAIPNIPKVVMGPIPSGGVGIEFHSENKNVYVSFYNDRQVDVSIEQNDNFTEHEVSLEQFGEEMGLFLEGIV